MLSSRGSFNAYDLFVPGLEAWPQVLVAAVEVGQERFGLGGEQFPLVAHVARRQVRGGIGPVRRGGHGSSSSKSWIVH